MVARKREGIKVRESLPVKLTPPKVDRAVPRTRLFQLLDSARENPVIWVSAPAGSGKTTLVASYLKQRKIKPLWYQFDVRDADPAAFFAYLRQAVGKLAPRKRETLPLLTPEYALGLPVFTLNFFEEMFNRLRPPAVVVFDNFQELDAASPLQELLPQVIAVLPEGMNIIFISRTDMPESFAPLRATRRVTHIAAEAMMLRDEEALEIGRQLTQDIAGERIELLNKQAGGWMAGLILLLESTQDMTAGKEIDTSVFDYFAAEIMRRSDERIQAFLTESALLPVMDAGATAALTGNDRAEAILRDLVRRNYFISRVPGEVMRYEFHPLFRNFLLAELRQRTSAKAFAGLQARAGRLLAERRDYAAAVELLLNAGAIGEVAALVLGQAENLITVGQFHTLERWLQSIPAEVQRAQPWLQYWLGVSRMPFDLGEAKQNLESAYAAFADVDDPTGCYLSWAGIAESFSLMWDDFSGMQLWLDEYGLLRGKHPAFPSAEIEARVQAALFGVLIFMQPQHAECAAARETVEKLLHSAAGPDLRVRLAFNLSLYYAWAGAFADMRRVVEMAEMTAATEMVSPLSRIMSKTGRGTLCWITGEPASAQQAIGEALQISKRSGVHLLDSYLRAQSVYASGILNDPAAMGETLEAVRTQLSPHRRIDIAHYHFQMSWYKSLCGDYRASLDYIRRGMELLVNLSVQMPIALGRLGLAKALIQTGECREAHDPLDQAIAFTQSMPSRHLEYAGRMIRAYAWQQQHQPGRCMAELEQALRIGAQESDYWTFPLWDAGMVSPLCGVALQNNIEPDYVRALIRKWRLLPTEESYNLEAWPWPVRVHVLGPFTLFLDGQPAASGGRAKTRVIDMLKALIAMGGYGVSEHRLCDVLWPEAEGDLARQNFKTTLHRLRKLIGTESVVLHDGLVSLDPQRVWLDLRDFECLLTVLEKAQAAGEIARLADEAIGRYRGGFLPQERAPWVLTMQERTRGRFLRIIDQAAECLAAQDRWAEALTCYRKAVEIEPLAERFYIGLMRCHYHLGQAADGLMVYRQCREALASELDVPPSALAEQWRERLSRPSH